MGFYGIACGLPVYARYSKNAHKRAHSIRFRLILSLYIGSLAFFRNQPEDVKVFLKLFLEITNCLNY